MQKYIKNIFFCSLVITHVAQALLLDRHNLNDMLLAASAEGCMSEIVSLLKLDANVNTPSPGNRFTPLMIASMHRGGRRNVIELLLAAKADVNLVDADGDTAIMIAVHCASNPCITQLLKAGPDLTIENRNKKTVFDIAQDRSDVLEQLTLYESLKERVDRALKDPDLAQEYWEDLTIEALEHDFHYIFTMLCRVSKAKINLEQCNKLLITANKLKKISIVKHILLTKKEIDAQEANMVAQIAAENNCPEALKLVIYNGYIIPRKILTSTKESVSTAAKVIMHLPSFMQKAVITCGLVDEEEIPVGKRDNEVSKLLTEYFQLAIVFYCSLNYSQSQICSGFPTELRLLILSYSLEK